MLIINCLTFVCTCKCHSPHLLHKSALMSAWRVFSDWRRPRSSVSSAAHFHALRESWRQLSLILHLIYQQLTCRAGFHNCSALLGWDLVSHISSDVRETRGSVFIAGIRKKKKNLIQGSPRVPSSQTRISSSSTPPPPFHRHSSVLYSRVEHEMHKVKT